MISHLGSRSGGRLSQWALAISFLAVLGAGLWIGRQMVAAEAEPNGLQLTPEVADMLSRGAPETKPESIGVTVVPIDSSVDAGSGGPVREPVAVPGGIPPEAASILAENDPQALFDLASGLLDHDSFVNQIVSSQVIVEMPAQVTANGAIADRAYWTLVHALAGQMYTFRPEVLAADVHANNNAYKLRADILQSIMPDLPGLIRDKKVTISMAAKGGADLPHGWLKGQSTTMWVDPAYTRMVITFRRGPWSIKVVVPAEVVHPDLWAAWVLEQKAQLGAK